ncbi:MAG: hypothetical protein ACRC10_00585 [Thermoguttaceae bacterium]
MQNKCEDRPKNQSNSGLVVLVLLGLFLLTVCTFASLLSLYAWNGLDFLTLNMPSRETEEVCEDRTQRSRPTSPYKVRAVYLLDSQGEQPEERELQNIRSALLLIQSWIAENMRQLGYGPQTFVLDSDENGQVVVAVLHGKKTGQEYSALSPHSAWSQISQEVNQHFADQEPEKYLKFLVIPSFDFFNDGVAATAEQSQEPLQRLESSQQPKCPQSSGSSQQNHSLQRHDFSQRQDFLQKKGDELDNPYNLGGGNIALLGNSLLAQSEFCPSSPRLKRQLGIAVHELGHVFGLSHTNDATDFMSGGFEHFSPFPFSEQTLYPITPLQNEQNRLEQNPLVQNQGEAEQDEQAPFRLAPVSASALIVNPWFKSQPISTPTDRTLRDDWFLAREKSAKKQINGEQQREKASEKQRGKESGCTLIADDLRGAVVVSAQSGVAHVGIVENKVIVLFAAATPDELKTRTVPTEIAIPFGDIFGVLEGNSFEVRALDVNGLGGDVKLDVELTNPAWKTGSK